MEHITRSPEDPEAMLAHDTPPGSEHWLRRFRYAPRPIRFSQVQWLVAQAITCGLSDKEIAFLLGISHATVKAHTGKIIQGLGFSRRTQLVRYMLETGQFDPESTEQRLALRRQTVGAVNSRALCAVCPQMPSASVPKPAPRPPGA